MSKLDKIYQSIKEQDLGATQKRALVLEGDDDQAAFQAWLKKLDPYWENKWVLAGAEKKTNVIELLKREPTWIGVVDADEWKPEVIEQKKSECPNLFVLPRFCLENYLCAPSDIWATLPDIQRKKISGGLVALDEKIQAEIVPWLQHGSLWHVINPLWEGLRGLGFKDRLLDIQHITDDDAVKTTLADWYNFLEPESIWKAYQERLSDVKSWPIEQQFHQGVHGKYFFNEVVSKVLSSLLGQEKANKRQIELLKNSLPPADLHPLWIKMELISD